MVKDKNSNSKPVYHQPQSDQAFVENCHHGNLVTPQPQMAILIPPNRSSNRNPITDVSPVINSSCTSAVSSLDRQHSISSVLDSHLSHFINDRPTSTLDARRDLDSRQETSDPRAPPVINNSCDNSQRSFFAETREDSRLSSTIINDVDKAIYAQSRKENRADYRKSDLDNRSMYSENQSEIYSPNASGSRLNLRLSSAHQSINLDSNHSQPLSTEAPEPTSPSNDNRPKNNSLFISGYQSERNVLIPPQASGFSNPLNYNRTAEAESSLERVSLSPGFNRFPYRETHQNHRAHKYTLFPTVDDNIQQTLGADYSNRSMYLLNRSGSLVSPYFDNKYDTISQHKQHSTILENHSDIIRQQQQLYLETRLEFSANQLTDNPSPLSPQFSLLDTHRSGPQTPSSFHSVYHAGEFVSSGSQRNASGQRSLTNSPKQSASMRQNENDSKVSRTADGTIASTASSGFTEMQSIESSLNAKTLTLNYSLSRGQTEPLNLHSENDDGNLSTSHSKSEAARNKSNALIVNNAKQLQGLDSHESATEGKKSAEDTVTAGYSHEDYIERVLKIAKEQQKRFVDQIHSETSSEPGLVKSLSHHKDFSVTENDERQTISDSRHSQSVNTVPDTESISEDRRLIIDPLLRSELCYEGFYDHRLSHSKKLEFTCEICGKSFGHKANLQAHLATHSDARPHICDICGRGFKIRTNLTKHVSAHSWGVIHTCKYCKRRFNDLEALTEHLVTHEKTKMYKCALCPQTFTHQNYLQKHARTHSNEKPHACLYCQKSFVTLRHLRDHLSIHTGNRRYECKVCGKKCSQKGHLNRHMRIHTGVKPHQCHLCPRRFRQNHSLKIHLLTHMRKQTCVICNIQCENQEALNDHIKTHLVPPKTGDAEDKVRNNEFNIDLSKQENNAMLHCSVSWEVDNNLVTDCSNTAVDKSGLKFVVKKRFSCQECGKVCASLAALKIHGIVHSKETPFKCPICSKAFKYKYTLPKHMRLMHSENKEMRPFACTLCGKSFKSKSNLSEHVQRHKRGKSFSCTVCGLHVSSQSELKKHCLSHKDQPPIKQNKGHDPINKAKGHDPINKAKGHDQINKAEGHDQINSAEGHDPINSAEGHDPINSAKGHDPIISAKGHDPINRAEGHDPISSAKGHDPINKAESHDIIVMDEESKGSKKTENVTLDQPANEKTKATAYKCSTCSRTFDSQIKLDIHAVVHQKPPYNCKYCNKNMKNKYALPKHIARVHVLGKDKPHHCDVCGKAFSRAAHLREHTLIHTNERAFPCKVCDTRCISKSSLRKHEWIHVRKHLCTICHQILPDKIEWFSHVKKHQESSLVSDDGSAAPPVSDFDVTKILTVQTYDISSCDRCNSHFLSMSALTDHLFVLHGVYRCSVCLKEFQNESEFQGHVKSHTNVKSMQNRKVTDINSPSGGTGQQRDNVNKNKSKRNFSIKQENQVDDNGANSSFEVKETMSSKCQKKTTKKSQKSKTPRIKLTPKIKKSCSKMQNKTLQRQSCKNNPTITENDSLKVGPSETKQQLVKNRFDELKNPCTDNSNNQSQNETKTSNSYDENTKSLVLLSNVDLSKLSLASQIEYISQNHEELVKSSDNDEVGEVESESPTEVCDERMDETQDDIIQEDNTKKKAKFECTLCSVTFTNKTKYNCHMRRHPNDREKLFMCEQCGKMFPEKRHLVDHQTVHSDARPHVCTVCNLAFKVKSNMLKHMLRHYQSDKLKCQHCGDQFDDSTKLNQHLLLHSDKGELHKCSICSKSFTKLYYLQKHMKRHSELKPHVCSYCGKAFRETTHLRDHVVIHTGERRHQCSVCDKKFAQKGQLNNHMKVHSGEKPHLCVKCGRRFRQSHGLKLHLSTHSHKCLVCGQLFEEFEQLSEHKNLHHSEKD